MDLQWPAVLQTGRTDRHLLANILQQCAKNIKQLEHVANTFIQLGSGAIFQRAGLKNPD